LFSESRQVLLNSVDHVLANELLAVIDVSVEPTVHLNIVDLDEPPRVANNCWPRGTHIPRVHERTHTMTVNVEGM